MNGLDGMDELAAEYVLGTLTHEERAAVDERRAADSALDKSILAWEQRLSPLVETVHAVPPPPELYSKIRAQIGLATNVVSLRAREKQLASRAERWRNATLAASALAASLLGVIGWREIEHSERLELAKSEQRAILERHEIELTGLREEQKKLATKFIAVLQSSSEAPAFLMTVDTKTHMCVISAITAPKQDNKSYEVWLVHDKLPKPKSLGIYEQGDMKPMPMDQGPDADMFMNATFAVSLEPAGGSPTGGPTGPVLFSGKFVQATP